MSKNNVIKKKKQLTVNFSNLYTDFIKNNMSLGHNSLKLQKSWHSNLSKFFIGTRNKTIILNYKFTLNCLIKALYVFTAIIKCNGNVLIVNTNPELSKLMYHIKKNTHCFHLFFSDCGWTKGTLTNWKQVFSKIKTFITFYRNFDIFLSENNIYFPNYRKMKKNYKGFLNKNTNLQNSNTEYNMNFFPEKKKLLLNGLLSEKNHAESSHVLNFNWKPDIIILMSTANAESIINEASSTNIPIIAFLDSNSNTRNITYPIPTNTYYYFFVWFFFNFLTKLNNKLYYGKII